MIIKNSPEHTSADEVVLFPFDDHSIPFQHGVRLHLQPFKAPVDHTRIVVGQGPPGAPDELGVIYYGSVHRVGEELWMWYLGHGEADTGAAGEAWHQRVCLATSRDGYNWEKPDLGLVEYNGSAHNNLVDILDGQQHHIQACVVFYDPDDADPSRRFKIVIETKKYPTLFAVAFSADGLTWREPERQPELISCEMSGGTKFNGCYYLSGHSAGSHFGAPRQLVTYASYDFEHWIEASCLGFQRDSVPPRPMVYGFAQGEQVHLGAALWNRGNVIVGLYGQWHGPENDDRRHVDMDLGLVVSNDALHYREPIPDFRMVVAAEDGMEHLPGSIHFKFSGFVQGQGFENIGDETLFWYAPWPEQLSDGVRVARWPRDRLGYLQPFATNGKKPRTCHVVSAPIDAEGQGCRVALNVDGLSEHARVTVQVLDEHFQPVPGFLAEDCLAMESGFHQTVAWQQHHQIEGIDGAFRIRLNYEGVRPEDPKLYAIYLERAK
jgi:hypothetical protein